VVIVAGIVEEDYWLKGGLIIFMQLPDGKQIHAITRFSCKANGIATESNILVFVFYLYWQIAHQSSN
jgi:hypothetical protein